MRHLTFFRRAAVLSSAAALALGCGAQSGDSEDRFPGGAGAGPSTGSGGTGAFGTKCPDCNALGDNEEGRAAISDDTQFAASGAGGGQLTNPSTAPACAGISNTPKRLESALGSGSSLASATLTRGLISMGKAPLPQHVRTQDLLNYFPPSFATTNTPANGDSTAPQVVVELAKRAVGGDITGATDYDLLVAVQAPTSQTNDSPDVLIVLDTTPSMSEGLERAKSAAVTLVQKLPVASQIRVRTSDSATDLRAAAGASRDELISELQQISLLEDERPFALTLDGAYADSALRPGGRVFVLTDGADDPLTIAADAIVAGANQDVVINGLAFAPPDEHGDRFFRALAWLGRGHYAFIDTDTEAESVLSQHLPAMLGTELQDVRVALSLPWHFKNVPRDTEELLELDGGSNKPQNMGPAAVGSFLYQLRTCDSTLVNTNLGDEITVTVRYRRDGSDFIELPLTLKVAELLKSPNQRVVRAAAIYTYAESLKTLDAKRLVHAMATLDSAASATGDTTLQGLSALLSQHPLLSAP